MKNEKKEFYIDFNGWTIIKATSEEEAIDKFWEMVNSGTHSTCVEIDGVEEKGN